MIRNLEIVEIGRVEEGFRIGGGLRLRPRAGPLDPESLGVCTKVRAHQIANRDRSLQLDESALRYDGSGWLYQAEQAPGWIQFGEFWLLSFGELSPKLSSFVPARISRLLLRRSLNYRGSSRRVVRRQFRFISAAGLLLLESVSRNQLWASVSDARRGDRLELRQSREIRGTANSVHTTSSDDPDPAACLITLSSC